ncbi:MAG: DUF1707 SHOCT-like domain-containing protein [Nocardioides sp.]
MNGPSRVPWAEFSHDPRRPDAAALRASDRDREVVLRVLGDGFADGRLDRDEYDERAAAATGARKLGDLPSLLADLVPAGGPARSSDLTAMGPQDLRARAERNHAAQLRRAVLSMLVPSLICAVIWLLSGFGPDGWDLPFPWPLLVLVGTGIQTLRVLVQRQEIVDDEQARLEKKQREALEARRTEPE